MENTDSAGVHAAVPQLPLPPPLRSDANPLRDMLTGLTSLDWQLPSSAAYFREHLRALYPSPFESEPRMSKLPLTHHITVSSQGPEPFGQDESLEDAVVDEHEDRVKNMRLGGLLRTIGQRPGEVRAVVESEYEFAISENGIIASLGKGFLFLYSH
ncbi:hypothetical protein RSAG8_13417, partial [Rhizoctonia solani AG-8 WAC10335]